MGLHLEPIVGIPLINMGDDIHGLLVNALKTQNISLENGDIIAVTSKIISKAEGRFINLNDVKPSKEAVELSKICEKNVRLIEIILQESKEIIRITKDTIIAEHNLGFICANAGIDHSNVCLEDNSEGNWYLLLPKNPDHSARRLRDQMFISNGKKIGIIIIDSHGRPWRYGTVGCMIGTASVPVLVDLRGKKDLFGYKLRITQVAAADELASAASLIMGQANEKIPAVHIRGFPYLLRESCLDEVIRKKSLDLFR